MSNTFSKIMMRVPKNYRVGDLIQSNLKITYKLVEKVATHKEYKKSKNKFLSTIYDFFMIKEVISRTFIVEKF